MRREQRKVRNEDQHDDLLYKMQSTRNRVEFYASEL